MSKRDVNESWADYLRRAMVAAGYEPDGVRSGGRTRLAADSGVSLPVISRSLNEGRTPDPATLRALAKPLGVSYRELLIRAGHATEEDLPAPSTTAEPPPLAHPDPETRARNLREASVDELLEELRRRAVGEASPGGDS